MNAGFTELSVQTRRDGHRALVTVVGDLDHHSAPDLGAALERIEDEVRDVDLDLAGVTFIDSGALQVFVSVHADLQKRGGALRFVGLSPTVARILDLTHLRDLFAE